MPRPPSNALRFLGLFAVSYAVLIALDQGLGLADAILGAEAWLAHAITRASEFPPVTEYIRVVDGDLVAKLWDQEIGFKIQGGLFSSNVMIWLALVLATPGLRPRARALFALGGAAAITGVNALGLVASLRSYYSVYPGAKVPAPHPAAAALYKMTLNAYLSGIGQYVPVGILYLVSIGGRVLRTLDASENATRTRTRSRRGRR
ncbi:MAG: hypothetical protein ACE5IL_02505 [Myxococcota bacterium]